MNRPAKVQTVGVIGSGGIAAAHLWAWRRLGLEIVVYSTGLAAAAMAAEYCGAAAESLDAVLDGVDVVDICTPTPSHSGIVAAAAAAGRHVVCEKPLALTSGDAAAAAAACADAGVRLYPAHVVRYFPEYFAAKSAVDAGAIGTPTALRLSRRSAAPLRPWFADRTQSGGVVMDQMIHDIDYARWIAGDVIGVEATTADGPMAPQQRASVVLTHAGGAISHLSGEWGPSEVAFATSFSLVGTRGTVTDAAFPQAVERAATAGDVLPPWQSAGSPYLAQAAEFLAALNGGPTPRVSAADGVAAVAVAEAANLAASTGRPVAL